MVWTPGSPEGLYSVGLDSQLVSWSTATTSRLAVESGADIPEVDRGETFGRYVFGITPDQNSTPSTQWQAYIVDIDTGVRSQWPLHLPANVYINQAVASWDGKLALISVQDAKTSRSWVEIWDVTRRARVGRLALPAGADSFPIGLNAAISPDGHTAYSSLDASRIGVFALPSGRYQRSFTVKFADPDSVRIAAIPWLFTPNGDLLFGAFDPGHLPPGQDIGVGAGDTLPPNQRLGLVDVKTGRLVAQTGLGDVRFPTGVGWSDDGSLFAVGSYDGTLALYDAHTLKLRTTAGVAEPGTILSISFAPDGRSLVTSGSAGLVDVWSVPDLGREGGRLRIGDAARTLAWYDRAGDLVGLAPDRINPGRGMRWFSFPAQPAELVSAACALAGTDMTPAEWHRYAGNRPYRHVCGS
jgi:WD40 repeat protein